LRGLLAPGAYPDDCTFREIVTGQRVRTTFLERQVTLRAHTA
jgi:hypothetical protein